MKNKTVALLLAGMMAVSIVACGEPQKVESEKTVVDEKEETAEEQEEPVNESEEVTDDQAEENQEVDESTVGEVVEENGMRKVPVITDKELNRSGETGPFKYCIKAIQVSKLTATTDESAEMLGIEKDKEVTLFVVDVEAENTSSDTNYIYMDQATLTTNTKEQVEVDGFLSDYIDGEYLGNTVHSGTLYYILHNSSADDITQINLHIDAPHNANFESIGDEVKVELNFE